jgi:hypothetical protein
MVNIDQDRVVTIKNAVYACSLCKGIDRTGALCINDKNIGLSYTYYPKTVPIEILFIAESPPKPGNDFFYDESHIDVPFRNRLFKLINASGLGIIKALQDFERKGYYLADAINCRWNKQIEDYLSVKVFKHCSAYLAQQIELFKPKFIVTMGNTASRSLSYPEVNEAIKKINIPEEHIIRMSLVLVASNENDVQRINKLKSIVNLQNATHLPMGKTIQILKRQHLTDLIRKVLESAKVTQRRLKNLLNESDSGIHFLHSLKFLPVGCNPLNLRDLNLIEQLNQTFTYLSSFKAAEYLWAEHPNEDSFTVNLGTAGGYDVHNDEKTIVAEVFATVTPKNNKKLKNDVLKVHGSDAKHKYVFFYCPGFETGEIKHLEGYEDVKIISLNLKLEQ